MSLLKVRTQKFYKMKTSPKFYTYISYENWKGGRAYIGKRECYCMPEEDTKYMGSFADKTFKPNAKIILKEVNSREDAFRFESHLHLMLNVKENPRFANKTNQYISKDGKYAHSKLKIEDNEVFVNKFIKIVNNSKSLYQIVKNLDLVISGGNYKSVLIWLSELRVDVSHLNLNKTGYKGFYLITTPEGKTLVCKNLMQYQTDNNFISNKKKKKYKNTYTKTSNSVSILDFMS